ncbi:hypothetical protein L218DRAFT_1004725 [Marasmius fiardii PR-910]|nr:hypothetical protein L218DRAFT_1004725 [Marasmius fiardii PR-910]
MRQIDVNTDCRYNNYVDAWAIGVTLLELLWMRHPVPFAFSLMVVGIAGALYILTTILPGLTIIHQVLRDDTCFIFAHSGKLGLNDFWRLPEFAFACPYKSPQSSWMFGLFSLWSRRSPAKWIVYLCAKMFHRSWKPDWLSISDWYLTYGKRIQPLSSWVVLDSEIIQRFSRIRGRTNFYHWLGFQWLVQETRDNPSLVRHVKNILGKSPQYLAMWTASDKWELDMELATKFFAFLPYDHRCPRGYLALTSRILAFRNFMVTSDEEGAMDVGETGVSASAYTTSRGGASRRAVTISSATGVNVTSVMGEIKEIWARISELEGDMKSRFAWAFFRPDDLLIGEDKPWKEVLDFYLNRWADLDSLCRYLVVVRLARLLKSTVEPPGPINLGSMVLGSSYGRDFVHRIDRKLGPLFHSDIHHHELLHGPTGWMEALDLFDQQ